MNKPEVGQQLFSLNVGNDARHTEQKLTPVIVAKVGRKYFWCGEDPSKNWMLTKYYIDSWCQVTEYTASSVLYESEKEYEDSKEKTRINKEMEKLFNWGRSKLSLDQLRRIQAITEEDQE